MERHTILSRQHRQHQRSRTPKRHYRHIRQQNNCPKQHHLRQPSTTNQHRKHRHSRHGLERNTKPRSQHHHDQQHDICLRNQQPQTHLIRQPPIHTQHLCQLQQPTHQPPRPNLSTRKRHSHQPNTKPHRHRSSLQCQFLQLHYLWRNHPRRSHQQPILRCHHSLPNNIQQLPFPNRHPTNTRKPI